MNSLLCLLLVLLLAVSIPAIEPGAFIPPTDSPSPADPALADYFRAETARLSARCLADIESLNDWKSKRDAYREQLQEMLGLMPWPERGDLQAVVTGKLEHEEFTVEKLHFQPVPKLYVTAALYLPKKSSGRLPAVLLESGHARFITNNISYGNKAVYQNTAAWFARNGYVCLNLDTLSLGEIQGDHLGTRNLGQWWWNSRGYTPAGVEAWIGIRALDYLGTRPEVDTNRIGITGHSGGGAYSWTVGALDDRVKAAAPMAGLTDLQNQVCDNLADSHCDCNFFINTYRWDFPQLAALLAPRPLLIGTTDKDRLFPVAGVSRLHQQVARLYKLYGETNKLGLVVTPGPHEWNAEGQLAVVRWCNRHLKGEDPPVETAAKTFFTPQQLKVFTELPADAINTNIQSSFVAAAKPLTTDEARSQRQTLLAKLKEKSFGGWPAEELPLEPKEVFSAERDGLTLRAWEFTSQRDVRLRLYALESNGAKPVESVALHVLDPVTWLAWLGGMRTAFGDQLKDELPDNNPPALDAASFGSLRRELQSKGVALVFFAPRGVGLTAWSGGEKRLTQIRRRFMLVGQTLDGMRVWDIRRAVQAVHFVREGDKAVLELRAAGAMASQARLAALFEPGVRKLEVETWREPEQGGGDYLNLSRFLDASAVAELNAALTK